MPSPERNPPPPPATSDPDVLAKALELELISKRAAWQRAQARRGTWRALSILFVLAILLGALLAYFVLLPQWRHQGEFDPERPAVESSR